MDLFEIDSLKNNSKNEVENENILQSNLMTFEQCVKADENDELKNFCSKFQIPPNTIYFCGNSLGLCPIESENVANQMIQEWEQNHIHSWNLAIQLPLKVGNKIGKLIGAEENETIIADSTSINLFKCLGTSIAIQKIKNPNRRSILLDRENFSNDLGLLKLLSTDEYKVRYFDDENQLEDFLNDDVVCILLSHVNYHHGKLYNMKKITEMVHKVGAFIIWDLCHSVGSVPINLTEVNADFAVGCTDKYLNSSPGAPAFIYVNKKHQNVTWQPLTGWLGHQSPFKMSKDYEPTAGIKNFLVGTPEVLPISIIDCSVGITLDAGMQLIRKKSLALGDLFIFLMTEKCPSFKLVTPFEYEKRGSHLSYQHENANEISKWMRKRNIYSDFISPDILIFAMTPLYTKFVDIWNAIENISDIVKNVESKNFDESCVTLN